MPGTTASAITCISNLFERSRWATKRCSGGVIRVRSPEYRGLWLLAAFTITVTAQDLSKLARAYSANPSLENRTALVRYASAHKDASGGLALLATGAAETGNVQRPDTLRTLAAARDLLPQLADYANWLGASVSFVSRDFEGTAKLCESVVQQRLKSPLSGSAAMLGAKAYIEAAKPARAIDILRRAYNDLSQPDGDAALAGAYDAAHDTANAIVYDQRVWLEYPASEQAQGAEAELKKYRATLGSSYPQPTPAALLGRAAKLIAAREYDRARRELIALSESTSGPERDLALVRVGEAGGHSRQDPEGLSYFESLRLSSPEADAERLYRMVVAARRLHRLDLMDDLIGQLARKYPKSEWRLQALVAGGNEYLLANRPRDFEPLFLTCQEAFPKAPRAPYCHWKVAFNAYLENRKDAADLLKRQLRLFPDSDQTSAALYFLGRLAERSSNWAEARAYYDRILRSFPNYYYAVVARERRLRAEVSRAGPSPAVAEFLRLVNLPVHPPLGSFDPLPAARPRLDRARLLRTAALDELAEMELRFGAKISEQPEVFGLELARTASDRSAPERAIRYLKRYAPAYLYSPLETAPKEFWRLSFPLPWRDSLMEYSEQAGLDPYMVAAVVRQESEFDPRAISAANAYGLTQILPSTGRDLSRRLRVRGFNQKMLLRPEFNLKLGTQYLKSLLAAFDGRWEPTLAAYNAGKSRVAEWQKRAEYREPAEFIEAIPFSETRNYVQVVLRNADLYRRLYRN